MSEAMRFHWLTIWLVLACAFNACSVRGAVDSSPTMIIVPKVSVGPIKAEMTRAEVVSALGPANTNNHGILEYWNLGLWIHFQEGDRVHIVMCLAPSGKDSRFKKSFAGHTQEGVAIGSGRKELLQVYGEPAKIEKPEAQPGVEIMRYRDQGLFVWLQDGEIQKIGVMFSHATNRVSQASATPSREVDYYEEQSKDAAAASPNAMRHFDRGMLKEPAYQSTPKYSLITLGRNSDTWVWMVEDGRRLFVDKNANGDLTDDGPPLMPADVRELDSTRWDFAYLLDVITPTNGSRHTHFVMRRWNYNDREDNYGLSLSVDDQMPLYAGWFGTFWSTNREKAPVIHFGGPFRPTLLRRNAFTIGETQQRLSLGFFHAGSEPGAESRLSIDALPASAVPELTIDWPVAGGSAPLRTIHILSQRCCYWEFYTTRFEVPKAVVVGNAKLSVEIPPYEPTLELTTTRMEVPVVTPKEGSGSEDGARH